MKRWIVITITTFATNNIPGHVCGQVAELCAAGGVPLDTCTNRGLAQSLAAAERVAPDPATVSLIKSLATRAMAEAQYFSTGALQTLDPETSTPVRPKP